MIAKTEETRRQISSIFFTIKIITVNKNKRISKYTQGMNMHKHL